MARNIPSNEQQKPVTKTTLSSKAFNSNVRQNKKFPRQNKAERIHLDQTRTVRYSKGTALRKGRKRVRERRTEVQKEK